MNKHRIVKTGNEARSAVKGHGVRYVLAIGSVATIILFLIIYLYFFA